MTAALPRRSSLLAPLLLGALLCACGDRTAAQIVLTPDPDLSPLATLLRMVRRIDVIVDAPEGLLGLEQPGPLEGGGTAVDWDDDGQLEVRFEGPTPGSDLPVLEIGVGENAGRSLVFRVFGLPEGEADLAQATGEGGASATVAAGEVRQVGATFNLTPRARPPQVLLMLPADGATMPGNLGAITAVLSTTIRPETLAGNVRLTDPLGAPVPVTATAETATVTGTSFGREERSVLSIELGPIIPLGTYELQIGPGIESTAGLRFDQDPATDAEEPFFAHLQGGSKVGGGGHPCDACPDGYVCDDDAAHCVPILTCAGGCASGFVCDAAQAQCVTDCRREGFPEGFCLDPQAICDEGTGLCRR